MLSLDPDVVVNMSMEANKSAGYKQLTGRKMGQRFSRGKHKRPLHSVRGHCGSVGLQVVGPECRTETV